LNFLYGFSVRRPRLVIVLALLITLGAAPGALRLKIRTDGHALVPADAPAIAIDNEIRAQFGVEDPIVVMIESNDPDRGVYNTHTLELVQSLTQAFRAIPGINPETLVSLETEYNFRVHPGTLNMRRLLDPMPQHAVELDELRRDIEAIGLYAGTVVSRDTPVPCCTAIFVGAPAGSDRIALYTAIRQITESQGDIPESISIIGAPVAEALLGTHILEDLGVPRFALGHDFGRGGGDDWFMPTSLYELRQLIAGHIGLLPISMVLMGLTFVVCFRSVTAAMLPLMEIGACLVFVFGIMGYADVPVYLTIAVLPLILVASGVADEIHLFSRYVYQLKRAPGDDRITVIRRTLAEMGPPIVKTSLTTAVGCGSFALSPLAPVQAFGIFTALGVLFCMMWSLTVVPAQLALISEARFVSERSRRAAAADEGRRGETRFAALGRFAIAWRWGIILTGVALVAVAPLGVRQIVIQDSWINGFAPESDFFRATHRFNDRFLGTHILLVRVDAGYYEREGILGADDWKDFELTLPGDIIDDETELVGNRFVASLVDPPPVQPDTPRGAGRSTTWVSRIESATRRGDTIVVTTPRQDGTPRFLLGSPSRVPLRYRIESTHLAEPRYLRLIDEFERFLAARTAETVGDAHGPARFIQTTGYMALGQKEEERRVPDNATRASWLWDQYKRIRGEPKLRQILDAKYSTGLVTIYMKDANFTDTARLMAAIRDYEARHLTPMGIRLDFGGDVAVSQTLIDAIVTTQVRSISGALLGVLLLTVILGRSLMWGVICALPCAMAVLLNFAMMGATGMPLGVATSMFTGMTLGMGVDFAIHIVERFRALRREGVGLHHAVVATIESAGPPVFIDAVAVAMGFGVMMLSQVPANARLGGLVVVSLGTCLFATLLLLPAIMRVVRARS
jgi:predicted RND superfamily exporter protein